MTPTGQALQVFYGTLPLILIILGVWFRENTLLKDILARLGRIEDRMNRIEERMDRIEGKLHDIDKRLVVLETRAGLIFHE